MKVLVTAGSTVVPIDQVRVISNIFKGKTGTKIAEYFFRQGDEVTLITSNPKLTTIIDSRFQIIPFRTYDDLFQLMAQEIMHDDYGVVIHSAAVSDYQVTDVYIKNSDGTLSLVEKGHKISSTHDSLFLEMKPTLKLIDLIRSSWGFTGKLVKFKLEVGLSDKELFSIAEKSLQVSQADIIVANCLEWSNDHAYIIGSNGSIERSSREQLPATLRGYLK